MLHPDELLTASKFDIFSSCPARRYIAKDGQLIPGDTSPRRADEMAVAGSIISVANGGGLDAQPCAEFCPPYERPNQQCSVNRNCSNTARHADTYCVSPGKGLK